MDYENKLSAILNQIFDIEPNIYKINDFVINHLNEYRQNNPVQKKQIIFCSSFGGFDFSKLFWKYLNDLQDFETRDKKNKLWDREIVDEIFEYGKSMYHINWHLIHFFCMMKFHQSKWHKTIIPYFTKVNNHNIVVQHHWFENLLQHPKRQQKLVCIPKQYLVNQIITKYHHTSYSSSSTDNDDFEYHTIDKLISSPSQKSIDKSISNPSQDSIDLLDSSQQGFHLYFESYGDEVYLLPHHEQQSVDLFKSIIEKSLPPVFHDNQYKYHHWYDPITQSIHPINEHLRHEMIMKLGLLAASGDHCQLDIKSISHDIRYEIYEYDGLENVKIQTSKFEF